VPNYDKIYEVCRRYEVPVIVDAAESLGASFNGGSAGVGAKAAIFSFNGNKIITTSGGGMLASSDAEFIERARFLSQQARDPAPHYEHSTIGYNYRMSNIVAAIGVGQLKNLKDRVEQKREIFDYYHVHLSKIPGIDFMPEAPYGHSNKWLTVILIDPAEFGTDRETIRKALEKENIESRPVWKPMHLQPVFAPDSQTSETKSKNVTTGNMSRSNAYHCRVIDGSVSESLFSNGLCLPSGTALTKEDLDRVIEVVIRCHR
jgi:dTDP-4-amino-4,6-dideoxygalactose transaminase